MRSWWLRQAEAVGMSGVRLVRDAPPATLALAALSVVGLAVGVYTWVNAVPVDSDKQRRLRVVITGGTRGLGAALAKQFIALGDDVAIAARTAVPVAVEKVYDNQQLVLLQCDISKPSEVEEMALQAVKALGSVDLWINNAGVSQREKAPLWRTPVKTINSVLSTNAGSIVYGSRMALRVLQTNELGGAVVNIDGAGSSGMTTPYFAAYGYTKAGLPQFAASLNAELKRAEKEAATEAGKAALQRVAVHTASPGMVTTDLLVGGLGFSPQDRRTRRVFNILAEAPDTVAGWMVPRLRGLVTANREYLGGSGGKMAVEMTGPPRRGDYLKFLTQTGAVWRFLSSLVVSTKDRLMPEQPAGGVATSKKEL